MPWVAAKRATLLVPSGPTHDPDRKHLHIVLTDPLSTTNEVLIVSVCSIPGSQLYDSSCTLFPNEHEFIKHDSYLNYKFCRIVNATTLEEKVADGTFVAKTILDLKRFEDVIVGLLASPHVTPKIRRFFDAAQP